MRANVWSRGLVAVAGLALVVGAAGAEPAVERAPEAAAGQPSASDAAGGSAGRALAPSVRRLLEAEYLDEEERRDLRVRHGVWTPADLTTPQRRATAALGAGAVFDAVFEDATVRAEDRAEAMLRRGEPERVLEVTEGVTTPRAVRLRAEAQARLGRTDDALATLTPLVELARGGTFSDAGTLVESVQGVMLRLRLAGPEGDQEANFQSMMTALARAREELDRLDWRVPLAEARLLYEKDNAAEASQALERALALHPTLAEAWFFRGDTAIDTFGFDAAEETARALEEMARAVDASHAGPTPESAWLRARVLLRQNEGAEAAGVIDAALERFPRHLGLLQLRAAATAVAWDFDGARAALAALDDRAPGAAEGHVLAGRALADARQYDVGEEMLAEATRRAPFLAEAWIERGLLLLQAGDDAGALSALERATALDPFNVRADNSLRIVRELRSYARVETEHFVIRHKPGVDALMAGEMAEVLEKIHARVTGSAKGGIDFVPEAKTVVELLPNHAAFAARITGMPRVHTIAAATGPVIAMEAPRSGPGHLVGPYDWARVVQHEFTHTVTLARTRNRLPHWFTEAAAVYLEDSPRDWSTVQMLAGAHGAGALFPLERINLQFIRPEHPRARALAYAQGHWMYEYIIERGGARAPLALMDLYAQGEREEAAFRAVLGVGREEFFRDFTAWAGTQLVAWGMREPEGVPSVNDLLERARAEGGAEAGQSGGEGETPGSSMGGPTPEMIERWLREHPEHPGVLRLALQRGASEQEGGFGVEDVEIAERSARVSPHDPLPHRLLAQFYLSPAAEGVGRGAADAIPHLEWLDAREQNSTAFASELARRYAALGRWDEAWAKALRATRIAPYDASARELAATVALKRGDVTGAERQIVALTVLEPDREVHQRRLEAVRNRASRE